MTSSGTGDSTVPLLETRGLSKFYGGVRALHDASITVHEGEHVGIMGDNGAGKSTMVKILSGAHAPTDGSVVFDGAERVFESPIDARNAGIETVYQDLSLADDLNVLSNLFLGREQLRFSMGGLSVLNRKTMAVRAADLLGEIGVNVPEVHKTVRSLSGGQRQGIAIARAAGWGSKMIIMDEPTAALGVQETGHVHDIIRRLKERGVAVMLVSHNVDQVFQVTDRIYVFRRGAVVGSRRTEDTSPEEIVSMITGAMPADSGIAGS